MGQEYQVEWLNWGLKIYSKGKVLNFSQLQNLLDGAAHNLGGWQAANILGPSIYVLSLKARGFNLVLGQDDEVMPDRIKSMMGEINTLAHSVEKMWRS